MNTSFMRDSSTRLSPETAGVSPECPSQKGLPASGIRSLELKPCEVMSTVIALYLAVGKYLACFSQSSGDVLKSDCGLNQTPLTLAYGLAHGL